MIGESLKDIVENPLVPVILRLVFLLAVCTPLLFLLSRSLGRLITRRYSAQQGMIAEKIVRYTGLVLIGVTIFQQLGFTLAPLLGAAGIIGIALGFASQTSVSNIISGFFLIAEESFRVGDIISVGDITGFVESVDVLSIKIRTFDNRFVRIPNETLIKTQVINVTRFPIRRLDVNISVAYKEDIGKVRKVLEDIGHKNPLCLEEPKPLIVLSGFGPSSVDILFAIWCRREKFLDLRNSIQEDVLNRFRQDKIEIPFPHVSIYAGSETAPFPVKISRQKQG